MFILGLAIVLMVGIVSAAVISYFGQVQMTATVNQAVLLDGQDITEMPIEQTATVSGGESFYRHHWLQSQTSVPVELQFATAFSPLLTDDEIKVTYRYYVLEKFTPTIDGQFDDGYTLVATDEASEMGNLPIKVYVACDENYMYWFFEAINPTTEEEGIGDTNILWNEWIEEKDTYLIVYLQETVYDYEGIWTNTPMTDAELARHTYTKDGVEICDTLEAKIPRSYADFLGWVYDVSSKAGMGDRNTSWGTVHYGDIEPSDWLDCPCKECGEPLTLPLTLEPYERVDFCICYEFALNIKPGTYTITTKVEPVT